MITLRYFTELKVVQALAFLLIPVILMLVDGGILSSISAYAYKAPMTFALSLTLAGALFFYDGYIERSRWYNMYVGIALFGVVLFPHLDYEITHYASAGVFFLGSIFNMIFFSSNKERIFKIITSTLILFGMLGHFYFDWYSLFWAEWIGMLPISIHFVLEATGKID